MPYHEAFYLAATDKIYAVMENYIVKCNATTGAKEASAKVCSPTYGPMRITGLGTSLYVAACNDFSLNRFNGAPYPTTSKQIWTVNSTTLAATNTLLLDDVWQVWMGGTTDFEYSCSRGPRAMCIDGGYIYFAYGGGSGSWSLFRINLTNPADNQITNSVNPAGNQYQFCEVFDINAGNIFLPAPRITALQWVDIQAPFLGNYFHIVAQPSTAPYCLTSCIYVPSNSCVYGVSGSDVMHKYDTVGAAMSTVNLGPVLTNGYPNRLRLSPIDGKLYIPSQLEDSIIVWTPGAETGILKTGFDSPIDVVFTGTKAWAVQTAAIGLKEIV